jgi:hypothetical protein
MSGLSAERYGRAENGKAFYLVYPNIPQLSNFQDFPGQFKVALRAKLNCALQEKTRKMLEAMQAEMQAQWGAIPYTAAKMGQVSAYAVGMMNKAGAWEAAKTRELRTQLSENVITRAIENAADLNMPWSALAPEIQQASMDQRGFLGENAAKESADMEKGRLKRVEAFAHREVFDRLAANDVAGAQRAVPVLDQVRQWGEQTVISKDLQSYMREDEYYALQRKFKDEAGKKSFSNAYDYLMNSGLPWAQRLDEARSPEFYKKFGLAAEQGKELENMLHVAEKQVRETAEKERNRHMSDLGAAISELTANGDRMAAYNLAADDPVLDDHQKAKIKKSLEDDNFGKAQDPGMVNFIIQGILDGALNEAHIAEAFFDRYITRSDMAELKNFYNLAGSDLKDTLKQWKRVVDEAYRQDIFASGTPEHARSKLRAHNIGVRILAEVYKAKGMTGAQDWIFSDQAVNILRGDRVNWQSRIDELNSGLQSANEENGEGEKRASAPPDKAAVRAEATPVRRPGEGIADYQQRLKLFKNGGGR